jgi:hypothetical protein
MMAAAPTFQDHEILIYLADDRLWYAIMHKRDLMRNIITFIKPIQIPNKSTKNTIQIQ